VPAAVLTEGAGGFTRGGAGAAGGLIALLGTTGTGPDGLAGLRSTQVRQKACKR